MNKEDQRFVLESTTKALLNFIPVIGGVASSILGDAWADRQYQRFKEMVDSLAIDFETHKEHINEAFVQEVDYLDIFVKTARKVKDERNEAKRVAYKNILLNGAILENASYDHMERNIFILNQLFENNLLFLSYLYNFKFSDFPPGLEKNITSSYLRVLHTIFSNWDIDQIIFTVQELENLQLIISISPDLRNNIGIQPGHFRELLTSKGKLFMKYVVS
jgi:hypothetical protein